MLFSASSLSLQFFWEENYFFTYFSS